MPNDLGPKITIERLGPGAEARVILAAQLFDHPPEESWVRRFLSDPTHHLLIAYADGRPVEFVSGVEMTHPDKGTEMFVYELGVAPEWRRKGIAKALLLELVEIAKEQGCYDMWVLTYSDNAAATASYTSAGATRESAHVLFEWKFER
ncbi:MAG: GNAT family N-acetyltransferase [Actinobacteria bacterium]|nr:GNAT family N-acetyltransferase [Actinomycetota bacterium]